jgi:hypothetical protein
VRVDGLNPHRHVDSVLRMQIDNTRRRAIAISAVIVAIVVGVVAYRRLVREPEVRSVAPTGSSPVAHNTDLTSLPKTQEAGPIDVGSGRTADRIGSAARYPVQLDALRSRVPNNRYWTLGAPTSDPEVAKLRAARAERDNAELGRIQANEASPEEIRAYYDERRAISKDYLEIAELVLKEQGDALPERDLGMFALSANLHRARLQQIERDQADALARIAGR